MLKKIQMDFGAGDIIRKIYEDNGEMERLREQNLNLIKEIAEMK